MPAQGIVRHLVAIAHGLHSMIRDDEIVLLASASFEDGRVGHGYGFPAVWGSPNEKGWRPKYTRHAVILRPGNGDPFQAVKDFLADKERVA